MRTCELCGAEYAPTVTDIWCMAQNAGNHCGGRILPRWEMKLPDGGIVETLKNGVYEGGEEVIIHFEPRVECLVCNDTGHVGINMPEGIEVRNCPRGCEPLVVEIDPKRLG